VLTVRGKCRGEIMKQLRKLFVLAFVLFVMGSICVAEEAVVDADKDAYTWSVTPDTPWGLETWLGVGSHYELEECITFIDFDLSELPYNSAFDSLQMELYVDYGVSNWEMDLHVASMDWDEATITWNNQPIYTSPIANWSGDASTGTTIVIPLDLNLAYSWYFWPDAFPGIYLRSYDENTEDQVWFDSRENPSGLGPKLRVTHHPNPPAEMTITPGAVSGEYDFGDPSFGDNGTDFGYTLESSGEGYLYADVTCDVDWMHTLYQGGWLPSGDTFEHGVIRLDEWPGPGTHVGNMIFTDPNAIPPADSLTVTLICHQAQLAVDPETVDMTWNSNEPEVTGTFEVQNPGDLALNWFLTESADWMSCSPVSGTVAAGTSETVTITCDTWPGEGVFNDLITITDENASPDEVMVDVTLTCVDIDMTLTLFPPTDPVVIAPGGSFDYDLQLESWLDVLTYTDFLAHAQLPNGNWVTITTVMNVPVQPNGTLYVEGLTQSVPVTAPAGDYVFQVLAGVFPNQLLAMDSFGITVEGVALPGGATDWSAGGFGERLVSDMTEPVHTVVADEAIPSEFALGQAYPNPFNPSTTLSVSLPEASVLNVNVYNVAGQQVATLANSSYDAGSHTLTFDASHLSGGVYFVQAEAGSWNDVQKVVLMK
jgi:Secretion system C-terminal sorting domain/Viral BACON domain